MRFPLISCLILAGVLALPAQAFVPEKGMGNSALDTLFADFEAACLPFILHEANVPREDDKAVYDDVLMSKGYEPGTRGNAEYIKRPNTKTESVERFDSYIKYGAQGFGARLYWHDAAIPTGQERPAARCEIRTSVTGLDKSALLPRLQSSDLRWQGAAPLQEFRSPMPPYRGSQKFTIFPLKPEMMGVRPVHYSLCAADAAGSIEVRFKIGQDGFANTMPLENGGEYAVLSVTHKTCGEPKI